MAQVADTLKIFQWKLEIEGMESALAQKATLPETEITQVEHGEANHMVKTPGKVKISNLKVEKIKRANTPENWAWNWLMSVQNPATGGGLPIQTTKKNITLIQVGNDGITPIAIHEMLGCWPCKLTPNDLDAKGDDNYTESIEFSVDEYIRVL